MCLNIKETFAGYKHVVILYNYETNIRANVYYKIRFSMGFLDIPTQTARARARVGTLHNHFVGKEIKRVKEGFLLCMPRSVPYVYVKLAMRRTIW